VSTQIRDFDVTSEDRLLLPTVGDDRAATTSAAVRSSVWYSSGSRSCGSARRSG